MKKTYLAPEIKAHKVQIPTILAGSDEQIKVDPTKTTPSMLSKGALYFDDFEDE